MEMVEAHSRLWRKQLEGREAISARVELDSRDWRVGETVVGMLRDRVNELVASRGIDLREALLRYRH